MVTTVVSNYLFFYHLSEPSNQFKFWKFTFLEFLILVSYLQQTLEHNENVMPWFQSFCISLEIIDAIWKWKVFFGFHFTTKALACNCLAYCCSGIVKGKLCCPFSNAVICCKAFFNFLRPTFILLHKAFTVKLLISQKYRFSSFF